MTARDGRGRALRGVVAVLLGCLGGCEAPAPSATGVLPSPSPVVSPRATVPSGAPPGPSVVSVELHALDPRYVPAVAPVSAAGQLLWTAGDDWPSELWRYRPGSPEPQRLFASPRAHANITDVAASASGYAFVEMSEPAFGTGGWRIWFLSGPGADPVELDRGRSEGAGFGPTVAMDDARIVWAGFDEPESGPVSRLATAAIANLGTMTTLAESPIRRGLIWFPTLNGRELWYGIIRGDFDATGVGDEFHLEMLDLTDPGAVPIRFAGMANDFNPAVNDSFVAWKTTDDGDAALNWGTLHVQDRRTQAVATIPVARANRPSIGERYIAFEEITRTRLVVYDPLTDALLDLAPGEVRESVRYGGQSLSGSLLAFYTQRTGGRPQIGWAILPT